MPRSLSRTAGKTLVELCRGVPPSEAALGAAGVVDALRRHRLAPLAHVAARRAGVDVPELRVDLVEAVGAHARNLAALRLLAEALDDLPWAVMKGPVLSELAHPVPGVRPYSDIDVLVHPVVLREVLSRLDAVGWTLLDRHHALVLRRMPGEVHLLGPGGAQVDLHWSLVNGRAARAAFRLDTTELLGRRVSRSVGTSLVPTLDDVDALLHLCVHAAQSGADRLLWLLDVDQWLRCFPPDWDQVVQRTLSMDIAAAVAVVLRRAARSLETPVPEDLDAVLGTVVWSRVDASVALLQPVPAIRRDRSVPRLVARASQRGTLNSAWVLTRRVAGALHEHAPFESAWQDLPDEASWEAFLDRVAGQGAGGGAGSSATPLSP